MQARTLKAQLIAQGFASVTEDPHAYVQIVSKTVGSGKQAEERCIAINDRHVEGPTDLLDRCLEAYQAIRRDILGIDPDNRPAFPIMATMGRLFRKALFLEKTAAPVRSAVVICCDPADWLQGVVDGTVHDQPRHCSLAMISTTTGLVSPQHLSPRADALLAWASQAIEGSKE